MIAHVIFLQCDAPGCMAKFSSEGLPASNDRYVLDAALRNGWTAEQPTPTSTLKLLCPAHSEKEAKNLPAEKAVRLLIHNPSAIRTAPPYLVGKLKLLLSDFNAKTFTWRKS